MSKVEKETGIQDQGQVKLVSLYSKVDWDSTVAYGETHIVVPPRGTLKHLDSSLLDLENLPKGVFKKTEE